MSRLRRVKISEKAPIKTLLRNYGVGSVQDYEPEQVDNVLRAIALLLDNTSYLELSQVARFLMQLTNRPRDVWEKAMEELEELGYY
jgi:hypothetical protein